MSINRVILSGRIRQYGVKITSTDAGTPHSSFTLVCEEPGRGESNTAFKTFIPVVIVGPQAEASAETLEPGDTVPLAGKLAYEAGKTKDLGKLQVVAFGVECLTAAAVAVSAT
jgi:single-stranded DNA-binding protein